MVAGPALRANTNNVGADGLNKTRANREDTGVVTARRAEGPHVVAGRVLAVDRVPIMLAAFTRHRWHVAHEGGHVDV